MSVGREVGLEDGVRAALVIGALSVSFFVLRKLRARARKAKGVPAPRSQPRRVSVLRFALMQAIFAAILLGYYRTGGWTAESVGVSRLVSPGWAFAVGVGEYAIFTVIVPPFLQRVGARERYSRAARRVHQYFTPDGSVRRAAMVVLGGFVNPLTEELLFRGLLVYQFIEIGGPWWLALAIGALVNAANHAYQGRIWVTHHLVFYLCSMALIFSPIGMVGAVGFHFAADLWPQLNRR